MLRPAQVRPLWAGRGRPRTPSLPTETLNITYSGTLKLDVHAPPHVSPLTVVIVHGGGWTSAAPAGGGRTLDLYRNLARHLVQHGLCVVNADYTVIPVSSGNVDTTYRETMLTDLLAVMSWARANAGAYNGSTSRIALLGESAGGQLVLMAAIRGVAGTTRPDAVVSWSGPTRLDQYPASGGYVAMNTLIQNLLGIATDPAGAGAATAKLYSPYEQWTSDVAVPVRCVEADTDFLTTAATTFTIRPTDHTDMATRITSLGGTAASSTVTTAAGAHADFTGYSELEATVTWLHSVLGA